MKQKLFTLFLALVASVGAIYAQSGSCGDNLTWTLADSVLTISGTGAMEHYTRDAPWYDYRLSIKSIVINDGVTNIGSSAFSDCKSLTSVIIGNSVTSIRSYAFSNCSSLTSITIPNSVTFIGEYAFRYCSSLTSVTIPNSVTSIGGYAFFNCESLTSVTIPNSVTSIGNFAFEYCSSLTSINVDANNANYCSIDGVLFSKDKTTLIQYPIGNTRSEYTIPNSVTSIGDFAFEGCTSLKSITIPNSVTSIGNFAFHGCSSLTSPVYNAHVFAKMPTSYSGAYTIPNGIESIAGGAFAGCSSLTSVTIPNSVTSIGNNAFWGCEALTSVTIPNSVTSIGNKAFLYCSSLISVTIPNSVTSIGRDAFHGTKLYEDQSNWENGVLYISNYLIEAEENISGAYKIKEGTRLIATSAFSWCSSLTSITIPNSVISIGGGAFYECDNITSITWNVKKYADVSSSLYAPFYDICTQITSFDFGDNVEHIPAYLCYGMNKLTSITIPNSVTSIGDEAFSGCTGLTSPVYNAHCFAYMPPSYSGAYAIPKGIKQIAGYAFYGCKSLTSVTIPNSVTSIGGYAFSGCSSLTSVTIPNSVTSIGEGAFRYCSSLTSVTIGNSVTSIGEKAFYYCESLTSVTIPNSVTSIGDWAFAYCESLTSVTIPNSVTSIGDWAFSYCKSLTSITIPNSVTSIGYGALAYDDALVAINVEQGNRAYSSVDGVLYNRDKTVIIAYPTGKTNNSYTILDGVNTIDTCAFIGNEYLEYINMPKTLISIDYRAFGNCTKLIKIVIPKTVRSIGERAFENCASLKKIYNNAIIPQEIDDQTFKKVDILNCELYVMPMAFTNYYNANIWKDFGLIETIEIGGIDIDDSKLEFTTTQKQANVLWASNSKATLYLLSMRRVGSEDTYTFTFDKNGYLISSDTNSLDFSKLIYLQNAAYSLTITDFDTDATYVYSFLYKDNEGNILHSESGHFSPDEFPEGIENVHGDEVQSTKVIKDGQVLILRNGKTYTMQGQEVK